MMAFESTLTCFTSSGWNVIGCIIGNGFWNIFGTPFFMTLFLILIGVVIIYKWRVPLDLGAVFLISLVLVGIGFAIPQWIFWVLIIGFAVAAGYGFYKFTSR